MTKFGTDPKGLSSSVPQTFGTPLTMPIRCDLERKKFVR